jgi:DNA-binding NarL/FixJ family response regulator
MEARKALRLYYFKLRICLALFKKKLIKKLCSKENSNFQKLDTMKFKKTIGVIDDHLIFRKGFIGLLEQYKHLDVTLEAENGKDLIQKLATHQPNVIFLDIDMPIMNGVEATIYIRERFPAVKIIILTSHYDEELMYNMIEKGVHGFFSKNTDIDKLVDAIKIVMDREYCFNYDVTKAMAKGIIINNKLKPEFKITNLSAREIDVLKLICKEHTNKEIADKLCLSIRTIDTYRDKIFAKTGVKNAVGLAFYGLRYGLIDHR